MFISASFNIGVGDFFLFELTRSLLVDSCLQASCLGNVRLLYPCLEFVDSFDGRHFRLSS
jgi:hypothetical protein